MICKFLAMLLCAAIPATSQAQDTPPSAKPAVPEVSSGRIVWWSGFAPAAAVGVEDVWVWLPPAYDREPRRRFPVLYMHDAENAFDRRLSNFDKEWRVDETVARMAGAGDLREWIVVGLRSPTDRYQTLFPQKLLEHLPEDYRARVTGIDLPGIERGRTFRGDAYVAMLAGPLKARVDGEFRTLRGAQDTAVMGASMGGLISLYAIAEYPEVFGQAAGVSAHLPLANPEGGDATTRAAQVAEAFAAYFAGTRLDPARNRIYVDHGTATLDASYPPYAAAFDAMMAKHGWNADSYQSRAFFGAEHEENAWAQRLDIPLAFLDRKDP